jgi:hypothetical protein
MTVRWTDLFPYGTTSHIWALSYSLLRFHWSRIIRHTVGLLWTSDQPVAETSTCTGQHNIIKDKPQCPQRDSNPRSQQPSGRRPCGQQDQLGGPYRLKFNVKWLRSLNSKNQQASVSWLPSKIRSHSWSVCYLFRHVATRGPGHPPHLLFLKDDSRKYT